MYSREGKKLYTNPILRSNTLDIRESEALTCNFICALTCMKNEMGGDEV